METCLDFTLPIETRMAHVAELPPAEMDELLERLVSAYLLQSTFLVGEFLQYLILSPQLDLRRRVRVAEMCDFNRTVLFLLTQMRSVDARLGSIELFANPALKQHAYIALYGHVQDLPMDLSILVHKNLHALVPNPAPYLAWFRARMHDPTVPYPLQANCADVLLRDGTTEEQDTARAFLKLDRIVDVYAHRENAHVFLPREQTREWLLGPRATTADILAFIGRDGRDNDWFRRRILLDKTRFSGGWTLEDLLQRVWVELTDDLRAVLVRDLAASTDDVDGWACTTGYATRILNVYQATQETVWFDTTLDRDQFRQRFTQAMNDELLRWVNSSAVFDDLVADSSLLRLAYHEFRMDALPRVTDILRAAFPLLPPERFTEWVADAVRNYEH